jgi:hypothetical protein
MKDFSQKVKRLLKKYGNKKIFGLRIGRRPINPLIEKAFNIISGGKWEKLRKQYYYDKLFHLFLIITLDDGTVLSFEKNEVVTMTENDSRCSVADVECVELEYPVGSITLNQLVKDPLERIGQYDYFIYDGFKANCQMFIRSVLQTFNLYSSKVDGFVFQDISEIVQKLPWYVGYGAKKVTDLGAKFKSIKGGDCGCAKCMSGGCHSCGKCPKKKNLSEISSFVVDMFNDIDSDLL